ncbi:MAG: hypothetical protein ACOYO0_10755 [Sandarakinorhabdus sp.]
MKIALKSSSDPVAKQLANEADVVAGTWRILATTVDLLGEDNFSGGSVAMFAAKKSLAVAGVANSAANNQGVRMATFVAGTMLATAEIGVEGAKAMSNATSPAKFGLFLTLKTAEKIVGAAGLADQYKCETAIASLTVASGAAAFSCVGSAGALCIFGAAGVALEAYNTYRQCQLPL